MNGGKQKYKGIETEFKYYFTPNWHILGSFLHQENQSEAGLNPTVAPENIFKAGTAYTWDKGSVGIFLTHYGRPPRIDSPVQGNPEPEAVTLLSLNLRMDVSEWMGLKKGQSFLTIKGEDLLNERVYAPTLAYTGVPNSFPYNAGRTFYTGLQINF
jgi:outer membrane receptor protein involved in Fe transport